VECEILKTLIAAFQFLSSFPIKTDEEVRPEVLGKSVAFFPFVGLVFGLILTLSNWILLYVFPKLVADVFLIIILTSLDGGMHLDGFIDTCDGLLGGRGDKNRILRIMKDSNVGAHGITCATSLFLLKFTLLYSLSGKLKVLVLMAMPTLARWAVSLAIVFFPYARNEGTGKVFSDHSGIKEFVVATIIALLTSFWSFFSMVAFAGVFMISLIAGRYFSSKIGGLTGDIYGALVKVNEIVVLMVFLVGGRLW